MAACALPNRFAQQREKRLIFFLFSFISFSVNLYTITHFPIRAFSNSANSYSLFSFLVRVIRNILRNLWWFCCTGLSSHGIFCLHTASSCCCAFVSENCSARGSLRHRTIYEQNLQKANLVSLESCSR